MMDGWMDANSVFRVYLVLSYVYVFRADHLGLDNLSGSCLEKTDSSSLCSHYYA